MKLSKKSVMLLVAALAMTAACTGCGKANIGYVNLQRVQTEAPQIKSILDDGQVKIKELEAEGNAKLGEAQKNNASQEELQKIQQEYQMKGQGIQKEINSELKAKVDKAMDEICKEKKLDSVMSSSGKDSTVISGGTDVTDLTIQKLQ